MKNRQNKQTEAVGRPLRKAVALRYQPAVQEAPAIVAKGEGAVAEQMLERAAAHGVPVQEDPSLVEVLSKLDLGQEIPADLYRLVAEVMSFIYRMDAKVGQETEVSR